MNYNSLCYNCFCEKPVPDRPCTCCGFNYNPNNVKKNCLRPGNMLGGRYLVGIALGVGGFGITYKCFDTKMGGICAVKEYFPASYAQRDSQTRTVYVDSENKERYLHVLGRFTEEAKLLKTLNHPNIIKTFDDFLENNTAYYVMEYCNGVDLRSYTQNFTKKLDYENGFTLFSQVTDGLEYIHAKNIMHRDIAPDNIYVTQNNHVKILDFGAARREMDQEKRQLSTIVKMGYAPIEQYGVKSKQGPFTDIYALGATFYHLFTGVTPMESTQRVAGTDTLVPLSRLRPDLPPMFSYCIEKSLAVLSRDRIQSVADMRTVLGMSAHQERVQTGTSQSGISQLNAYQSRNPYYNAPTQSSSIIAPIFDRCLAYIVDFALVGIVFLLLFVSSLLNDFVAGMVASIVMMPFALFLYGMLMEICAGATVGKKIVGLYVRGCGSENAQTSQIVLRNLIKLLGVICLIPAGEKMMLQEKLTDSCVCKKQ